MAFLRLHQFSPVHTTKNYTLDLGFSKIESLEVLYANDYLVDPDHHYPPIVLTMPIDNQNTFLEQSVLMLNYKNANYEELNKIFNEVNWRDVLYSDDLDKSVSKFYEIVKNGVVSNVPK